MTTADVRKMIANMQPGRLQDQALRNLTGPRVQPVRKPGKLDVTFALQVRNTLNRREHFLAKSRRSNNEKTVTHAELVGRDLPALPAAVTLTRYGPKVMDSDGNSASLKFCRDSIAELYGVDDGSDLFDWRYEQAKGAYAVRVVIVSAAPAGGTR